MHKTVFVVGAGASAEFDLPVGTELKQKIRQLLDIRYKDGWSQSSGDQAINDAFRLSLAAGERDINPYLHAAWKIRDSMDLAPSIDNFLHVHAGDKKLELCGKLGIVQAILKAEAGSRLFEHNDEYNNPVVNFSSVGNTWISKFFQCILGGKPLDQAAQVLNATTFVIFNYDRCIEHYLFHALRQYYSISSEKVAEVLSNVRFFHPYGTCGKLQWQSPNQFTPYGHSANGKKLLELSQQIRTFTEGTDESDSEILAIRRSLAECDRAIFLGFGFINLNMKLLAIGAPDTSEGIRSKGVYGTAKSMSSSDAEILAHELQGFFRPHIAHPNLSDSTCSELFDQHWRAFSTPYT